jgi:hypothetical protein
MTHASWTPAVVALEQRITVPTAGLLEIAGQLEIPTIEASPAMVLAATIQDTLDPILWGRPSRPPSEAQVKYLTSLAEEAGEPMPAPSSAAVAGAWIDVFLARRTIDALLTLKLQRGDVVDHRRLHGETALVRRVVVSSLGDDGLVYFRGGNGQCGWPSALRLVARADTPEAQAALEHERFWMDDGSTDPP